MKFPKRFAKGSKGEVQRQQFANDLMAIQKTVGFKVSGRGWCYILEEHGLLKGDFSRAEKLINDCRKTGLLPVNFTARDDSRQTGGIETALDQRSIYEQCSYVWHDITSWFIEDYKPFSFWDNQKYYVEMVGEKIDLKTLFSSVCKRWNIPYTNLKGWSDINSRADLMNRLMKKENEGKQCVVLYCGDHDPGGLAISDTLRKNLNDLAEADGVGWYPDEIIIERFGLNFNFIEANNLSWIGNLETSSGKRLDDPNHPDHYKPYVQNYIGQFGVRKVEANSLVVRPEAGRQLCEESILKYIDQDAAEEYNEKLEEAREELADAFPAYVSEVLTYGTGH